MIEAETDESYRERILRVVNDEDRPVVLVAITSALDAVGRRYGRFRYGVPLEDGPDVG